MNPNRHFNPTAGLENYDTFIAYSRHLMNAAFEFSLDKIVIQNAPCCNDLEFVYDTASRVFIGRDNLKTHHVAITVNTAGK